MYEAMQFNILLISYKYYPKLKLNKPDLLIFFHFRILINKDLIKLKSAHFQTMIGTKGSPKNSL